MKHTEFVSKLLTRFPGLKDKTYQLQDIQDNISDVGESSLDDLWHAFNGHYDRDTPPRWASINTAALKAGLFLSSNNKIKFWVFRCDYCGSYFGGHSRPSDGQKCTGCKLPKPATIVTLDKDENPFNMNKRKFDDIAGNTVPPQKPAPHPMSIDYQKATVAAKTAPRSDFQAFGGVSARPEASEELF